MKQTEAQVPEGLQDRGVGWQAGGFTLTAIICLVVLNIFGGSDFWLYQSFETAVVRLYWALVVPLAALFDGGRKLFERGKAIREAKKAEIREKGLREGAEKERERIRKVLEAHGVTFPPLVAEAILGKRSEDDS